MWLAVGLGLPLGALGFVALDLLVGWAIARFGTPDLGGLVIGFSLFYVAVEKPSLLLVPAIVASAALAFFTTWTWPTAPRLRALGATVLLATALDAATLYALEMVVHRAGDHALARDQVVASQRSRRLRLVGLDAVVDSARVRLVPITEGSLPGTYRVEYTITTDAFAQTDVELRRWGVDVEWPRDSTRLAAALPIADLDRACVARARGVDPSFGAGGPRLLRFGAACRLQLLAADSAGVAVLADSLHRPDPDEAHATFRSVYPGGR